MAPRALLVRRNDEPADDRPGDAGEVTASVIYGGPFDVFETGKYPFLNEVSRWIGTWVGPHARSQRAEPADGGP